MDVAKGLRPTYGHSARQEMQRFIPGTAKCLLEIGCNTGGFGAALKATRNIEIWGIEPDPDAAAEAALLLDRVIASPFTDDIDVPDAYFDAVVFNDVLEHMIDPWAGLRLAARKLAPEGVVIASIPNLRHVDNLEHILLDADFQYESHGIRDCTHLRFFTLKSARRMFEDVGFEILREVGINASWWNRPVWQRVAFRIWREKLDDTKFQQFAFIARPAPSPSSGHE